MKSSESYESGLENKGGDTLTNLCASCGFKRGDWVSTLVMEGVNPALFLPSTTTSVQSWRLQNESRTQFGELSRLFPPQILTEVDKRWLY